jgi:hypothetical protein
MKILWCISLLCGFLLIDICLLAPTQEENKRFRVENELRTRLYHFGATIEEGNIYIRSVTEANATLDAALIGGVTTKIPEQIKRSTMAFLAEIDQNQKAMSASTWSSVIAK